MVAEAWITIAKKVSGPNLLLFAESPNVASNSVRIGMLGGVVSAGHTYQFYIAIDVPARLEAVTRTSVTTSI